VPQTRQGLSIRCPSISRWLATTSCVAAIAAGGGVWWAQMEAAAVRTDQRAASLESSGLVAADAIGSLLAAGDLSGARRMIARLAEATSADECRIEIPGLGTLADVVPSRTTLAEIPTPWPPPVGETQTALHRDALTLRFETAVSVGTDRAARLVVVAPIRPIGGRAASFESASLPIGAALFAGAAVLAAGLSLRRRIGDLLAVGESVAVAAAGESALDALLVDERFGPLAGAWNGLVPRLAIGEAAIVAADSGGGDAIFDHDAHRACDALWHGVVVFDPAHRVRYVNGAAALLLGVRREDALGMSIDELLRDESLVQAAKRAAGGEATARTTVECAMHDAVRRSDAPSEGEPPTIVRCSLRGIQGAGLLFVEDVTQQRLADRSRDAFVAQATHELRTPLTNIRLAIDDLLDDRVAAGERTLAIDIANREARRLERMVGDMLSISEIEAGTIRLRPDDVRLDAMIEELRADFESQAAERRIAIEWRLPPKYPQLVGDRDKIQMTVANLLGNALKYTPEGGAVVVAVVVSADDVRIDVVDSGIGIAENEQELVFRSFYRSKDRRVEGITGTGLGLPIARQIARLHGGDILLKSAIDRGSTFTFVLPLKSPLRAAA
jgi:signal transduction histidine kinase